MSPHTACSAALSCSKPSKWTPGQARGDSSPAISGQARGDSSLVIPGQARGDSSLVIPGQAQGDSSLVIPGLTRNPFLFDKCRSQHRNHLVKNLHRKQTGEIPYVIGW